MSYRTVYLLVASSTKNKVLESRLIRFMRSINPDTFDYETEENIMNCFLTLEQAEDALKRMGEDKKVSIIALSIPVNCVLLQHVGRNGHSKRDMQKYVYAHTGYKNYLTSVFDGNEKIYYLVLTDISYVVDMFDPKGKGAGKKEGHRLAETREPRPEVKRTMQECVQSQAAEPDSRGKWMLFWAGLIIGIMTGLILARGMEYHPFMIMAVLSLAVTAGIYYYFLHKK